ncbi:MAG: molecular chaperone GrpE [Candidatus Dependentiae bacterium]|nr:molecular chaperone GrpE [Candidatus Dependentiae bacterium]
MEDTHNKHEKHNHSPETEIVEPVMEAVAPKNSEEENYKNQFLRMSADFANHRRRVEKERSELIQIGQNAIIKSFLPLLDDIERAFDAAKVAGQQNGDHAGLKSTLEGLSFVEKNMRKILDELGVQEIACVGVFDPNMHEALMQVDTPGAESGTIVQVLSKGYSHKGVVIRHAKVSVAA